MNKYKILGTAIVAVVASVVTTSCNDKRSTGWQYAPNMYEKIAYDADQKNEQFKDGKTAQVPPANTTPIGFTRFDFPGTKEGYEAASAAVVNPLVANAKNLEDGKKLFTTFCSPCHGVKGMGDGTVTTHGYPAPPSYSTGQSSRGGAMKDLTDGKIYHTITYGVNSMGSYASQVAPEERWKIVMYVHQLQNL
ncbi:c-type cytochrome [Mucilaginibacter auburnensis]|nr:cytochrome c [Mucilaginibacter auburnensis]